MAAAVPRTCSLADRGLGTHCHLGLSYGLVEAYSMCGASYSLIFEVHGRRGQWPVRVPMDQMKELASQGSRGRRAKYRGRNQL